MILPTGDPSGPPPPEVLHPVGGSGLKHERPMAQLPELAQAEGVDPLFCQRGATTA